jgi:hypothetical protein
MPLHTVAQGDCISSIAKQYGVPWDVLWNHPDNAALREKRKDPNVLYPGDSVSVPDRNVDYEPCATDQRHQFQMKAQKAKLRLRILQEDKPRVGEAYRLEIEGFIAASGKIDSSGFVTESLPPGATSGKLYVGTGLTQDVYSLNFGVLDPIDTPEGVAGRLLNLGYGADNLKEAISAFQQKEKLPVNGEADDATRARLVSRFGQ